MFSSSSIGVYIAIGSAVLDLVSFLTIAYKTTNSPTRLRYECLVNGASLYCLGVLAAVHAATQNNVPPTINEIVYRDVYMFIDIIYTISLTGALMRLRSRFVPHEKKHNALYWAIVVDIVLFVLLALGFSVFISLLPFDELTSPQPDETCEIIRTIWYYIVLALGLISVSLGYCYVFFPLLKMKRENAINKDALAVSIWYLSWVAGMVLAWILLHIIGDGTSNDLLQTGEDGLDCLLRMCLVTGLSLPPPRYAIRVIQERFSGQVQASRHGMSTIVQNGLSNHQAYPTTILPLAFPTTTTNLVQTPVMHKIRAQVAVDLPRTPSPVFQRQRFQQQDRSGSGVIFSRPGSPAFSVRHKRTMSNMSQFDDRSSLTMCMHHADESSDEESPQGAN